GGTRPLPSTATRASPPGCPAADRPTLSCTPQQNGTFRIDVTVVDHAGWALQGSAILIVHPQPTISGLIFSPSAIDLGMTTEIQVTLSGGTPPYVFDYSGLPPGCASVDSPALSCKPTAAGSSLITVRVTDAFGWNATASGGLEVNPDLIISGFAANLSRVDVGIPVEFSLTVVGGTGNLTVAYSGGPPGCTFGDITTTTCSPKTPGRYTISVQVIDALGETANGSFNLTVDAVPSISDVSILPSQLDVGAPFTIRIGVQGGTPPIRFVISGEPPGCGAVDPNGTVRCTGRSIGVYDVQIQIADPWYRSTPSSQVVTVDRDPFIERFLASPDPVTVGGTTVLSVDVIGGTGSYTYLYTGLPGGCPSTNRSTLSCRPTSAGVTTVTVSVTDSSGFATFSRLNLTVSTPAGSAGSGAGSVEVGIGAGAAAAVVVAAIGVVLLLRRRRPRSRTR
ncbi:thermopsin, partial [mine drainage metagenome]